MAESAFTPKYPDWEQQEAQFRDFSQKLPAVTLFTGIKVVPRWGELESTANFGGWFEFLSATDDAHRGSRMQEAGAEREFYYIRLNDQHFLEMVAPHMNKGVGSFIDVGCGGGDKLALIKEHWPHVHTVGIEHDPAMAAWASTVGDKVFCGDAFRISYRPYDVIYAYYPIADPEKMTKLCEHIVRSKRPEAKFILVGFSPERYNKELVKHIILGR
jgi:SAM-dependent methyltransferase